MAFASRSEKQVRKFLFLKEMKIIPEGARVHIHTLSWALGWGWDTEERKTEMEVSFEGERIKTAHGKVKSKAIHSKKGMC